MRISLLRVFRAKAVLFIFSQAIHECLKKRIDTQPILAQLTGENVKRNFSVTLTTKCVFFFSSPHHSTLSVDSMAAAHVPLRIFSKSNSLFLNCRCTCNVLNTDLSKQICFSRLKSTSVTAESAVSSDQEKFQKDDLDLTFENTKDAYKSKTTWELIRALTVLKLTTLDYLVENNQKVSIFFKIIIASIYLLL